VNERLGRDMKIFITGGSGFVGTTLTQKLTDLGHQVTILTRSLKPVPIFRLMTSSSTGNRIHKPGLFFFILNHLAIPVKPEEFEKVLRTLAEDPQVDAATFYYKIF
jgi:nucleoside-diphosphate-sugar epimerase